MTYKKYEVAFRTFCVFISAGALTPARWTENTVVMAPQAAAGDNSPGERT
jgi:hypothetical protein